MKIGIGIGIPLSNISQRIALKSDGVNDFIATGIGADKLEEIHIWGAFYTSSSSQYCGANGTNARYYFGKLSSGEWALGVGSSAANSAPLGSMYDTDYHKFSIVDGKLLIDDIEVIDKSGNTLATSEEICLYALTGVVAPAEMYIEKAIVNGAIFMPHPDGYFLKDGIPVYNRGEASNLYPLEVVQL